MAVQRQAEQAAAQRQAQAERAVGQRQAQTERAPGQRHGERAMGQRYGERAPGQRHAERAAAQERNNSKQSREERTEKAEPEEPRQLTGQQQTMNKPPGNKNFKKHEGIPVVRLSSLDLPGLSCFFCFVFFTVKTMKGSNPGDEDDFPALGAAAIAQM